jgi:hypothetical protein
LAVSAAKEGGAPNFPRLSDYSPAFKVAQSGVQKMSSNTFFREAVFTGQ